MMIEMRTVMKQSTPKMLLALMESFVNPLEKKLGKTQ